MPETLSRRRFLALVTAAPVAIPAVAAVGTQSPSEWSRYPDPATELDVVRLTDPRFASGLTAPHLRQFTRHSDYLLCWSDRSGSRQAFLANLRTGENEQLTEAEALDPTSLSLTPDERSFCYFDGPTFFESPFPRLNARVIHRTPDGSVRTCLTLAGDGSAYFAERTGDRTIILRRQHGPARQAFETEGTVEEILARPGNQKSRLRLLYRQDGGLWVAGADGSGRRQLRLEPGRTGRVFWTPSGSALVYLHIPEGSRELISLREHNPETGADTLLASTSQFISASPNGDGSVFVAASRSIASPYVLIMLRKTRRELTLAEHRASDAAMVSPVFTPDSRNILFVSDRHGKPAVYLMGVGKFVEETGGDDGPDAGTGSAGPRRQNGS